MPLGVGLAIRRFTKYGNTDGPVSLRGTGLGSLAVANVEMLGTEMLRAGRRYWAGHINGATFQAQQTATPTTTAGLLVYNGESGPNAKSYVLQQALGYAAGGTAGSGITLYAAALRAGAADFTVPTGIAAGTAVTSMSGKTPNSNAKTTLAATVANNGGSTWNWIPLATGTSTALWQGVVTPQNESLMLVPPGGAFAFTVVSAAGTTPTFGIGCFWDELELDLE
jgi:hypothetical protein